MTDKTPLAPALVNEFVGKAHGDLDRVCELLERHPTLVNAAWDWGGGDWETALGAAAHVGRHDIALHLIDNGARIDIFAAAMLGYLPIVRATLEAIPSARQWRGHTESHCWPTRRRADRRRLPSWTTCATCRLPDRNIDDEFPGECDHQAIRRGQAAAVHRRRHRHPHFQQSGKTQCDLGRDRGRIGRGTHGHEG
jgi:hypothetical protein